MPSGFSPSIAELIRQLQFRRWDDWEWFGCVVHFWGEPERMIIAINLMNTDCKLMFLDPGEDPFEGIAFIQYGGRKP